MTNNEYLNKLRAAVLGANDGIISTSTALVAIIGVLEFSEILLTTIAIITAGAISMGAGEYVSVAAQKDVEKENGSVETSPTHAAISSFIAFIIGAIIPGIVTLIFMSNILTILSAILMLAVTSVLASKGLKSKARKNNLTRQLLIGCISLILALILNSILTTVS